MAKSCCCSPSHQHPLATLKKFSKPDWFLGAQQTGCKGSWFALDVFFVEMLSGARLSFIARLCNKREKKIKRKKEEKKKS